MRSIIAQEIWKWNDNSRAYKKLQECVLEEQNLSESVYQTWDRFKHVTFETRFLTLLWFQLAKNIFRMVFQLVRIAGGIICELSLQMFLFYWYMKTKFFFTSSIARSLLASQTNVSDTCIFLGSVATTVLEQIGRSVILFNKSRHPVQQCDDIEWQCEWKVDWTCRVI